MNFYQAIFATVSILVNLLAILLIYLSFISPFDITLDDGTYMSDFRIFREHLKLVILVSLIASSVTTLAGIFLNRKGFFKISVVKTFLMNFFLLLFLFVLAYGYFHFRLQMSSVFQH